MATGKKKPAKKKASKKKAAVKKKRSTKQALNDIADDIRDLKTPVGNVTLGDEQAWADITSRVSTGCTPLDGILGGGIPYGRACEVFGNFAQGKSALLEKLMANNQRAGGLSVLISSEGKFDKPRMARLGINLDELMVAEVADLTQGFLFMFALLDRIESSEDLRGKPILIGWDTISNAPTEAELAVILEKTAEEAKKAKYKDGLGDRAREIRGKLRSLTNIIAANNVCLVFVSQTIARIGGMTRSRVPETPGGGGIKFLSSLRLLVKSIGRVDDPSGIKGAPPIGIIVQVEIAKSSICRPFRNALIPLHFEGDFDDDMAVWNYLLTLPATDPHYVCFKRGSWSYIRTEDGQEHNFYEKDLTSKIDELGCREYLRRHCLESIRGV